MDLGWGAVLVAVLVIVLTGHQIRQLLSAVKADRRLSTTVAVQWLAGVSALALMLHSWVDFNMRIPALAMTASFLAGVFLRDPGDTPTARHG
jgi:hypothetical protein